MQKTTEMNSTARRFRCFLLGHDFDIVTGAPIERDLRPNGRPKLYKAILVCARCGHRA